MISKKELLINILYNLFGWRPIHQTRYKKNKEISITRRDILYNNLEYCHSPLSMNELEWCYRNENEIQRDYLSLENYHQDKFSHKRMDIIMICLLLSLLTCLVVAYYTEFAYFFFYMGLMGLILYIYGYKLWNKIQGANFLKYCIDQIEEQLGIEEQPEPLVQTLERQVHNIQNASISLEGKVSGAIEGIQKSLDFQTKTIQETITDVYNQNKLEVDVTTKTQTAVIVDTITSSQVDTLHSIKEVQDSSKLQMEVILDSITNVYEPKASQVTPIDKIEEINEVNSLSSILTCLEALSSSELLSIKDSSMLNYESKKQYIFTIPQSQLTFLLALLVRNNKITLAHRKQTEIARFIAKKFYYEEIDSIESKYKDINNDAFAKELNKFSKMDATTFKDKYHAYKPDLRYFYEVFNLKL